MEKDPRVRWFHARRFCLRTAEEPDLARASGDSGFVAHLAYSTHGATGWDWSFKLLRLGDGWAFATDGRVALYLDEPGQYVPHDAKVGDVVAVKLPRARENLVPHRFTVYGGQGGPVLGKSFVKLFVPITFEVAGAFVEILSGRAGDQLRFGLHVANHQSDFARADAAVIDVAPGDEPGILKALDLFVRAHPKGLVLRGLPWGTQPGAYGLPRGEAHGRGDVGDGFGWRKSREAIAGGLESGVLGPPRGAG